MYQVWIQNHLQPCGKCDCNCADFDATHRHPTALNKSMEQSPSWEANRRSASQEIPSTVWNPNVHYCAYKSPPPVPILSQSIPSMPLIHFLNIHFVNILPSTAAPSKWFHVCSIKFCIQLTKVIHSFSSLTYDRSKASSKSSSPHSAI